MTLACTYRLGWERIFGIQKPKGKVYLLPSDATRVIVQYTPDFRISCLLSGQSRNISVEWAGDVTTRKINTPNLLLSHIIFINSRFTLDTLDSLSVELEGAAELYSSILHSPICSCLVCINKLVYNEKILNLYYLYGLSLDDNKIYAQPYRLSNVYDDGKICFRHPSGRVREPKTLREANSSFWSNSFSNDFLLKIEHECLRKRHFYTGCFSGSHRCKLKDGTGGSHHKHVFSNGECPCCTETCLCNIECLCCNEKCDCLSVECDCACCKNICGCRCQCDLLHPFADKIMNYTMDSGLNRDHTKLICGDGFISTTEKVSGVFMSDSLDLVDDIPKEYLVKYSYRISGKPYIKDAVIGFVSKHQNGWEVKIRDFSFVLSDSQVNLVG